MKLKLLLFVVVAVLVSGVNGALITSLPGLTTMPAFKMYSGYIDVDPVHGRNLFYFFAESQENPEEAPTILWQQGGPGCSSLIGNFLENGPFRVTADLQLEPNGWAWNRFANYLVIDSPAGVGFSYSNTPGDYNTNNTRTTNDTYAFLERFFAEEFPQFAMNPFWISGESYAGDYNLLLASRILNGSNAQLSKAFSGIALGNPVMSCPVWEETSNDIQVNLFYFHGLIPFRAYSSWKTSCSTTPSSSECTKMFNEINSMIGPYDPDNLYTDALSGNATLGIGPTPLTSIQKSTHNYLNLPSVRVALGVHSKAQPWVSCCAEPGQSGGQCQLNYTNHWSPMAPYYEQLFQQRPDVRILVYSGDVDIATCPHAYTQLCLASLNQKLVTPWAPWQLNGQTAGYLEVYDTYTFATVKGAGHEVPMFQPAQAFTLIKSFILGR